MPDFIGGGGSNSGPLQCDCMQSGNVMASPPRAPSSRWFHAASYPSSELYLAGIARMQRPPARYPPPATRSNYFVHFADGPT